MHTNPPGGSESRLSSKDAPAEPKRALRPPRTPWERFQALLGSTVSGASLAAFRIGLGLVMALEAWALFQPDRAAIAGGTSPMETYYAGPDIQFHFPYAAFEWLPLLPGPLMRALAVLMGVAGVTMALGLFYRASVTTVFLAWGYFFAVESTRTYWQSHYYLELLLLFLMIWMPAAARFSLDARRRGGGDAAIPFWPLFLLRGQLAIAYFYAGAAKLNADWLLDAVPVRWFLARPAVTAPYERFLSAGQMEWLQGFLRSPEFAYFISYTGMLFDLGVGALLLIRRTRIFALICMVIFHAVNHALIFDDIGWFPLMGIATALIFLDADWPERFWKWARQPRFSRPDWKWFGAGAVLLPGVGAALGWKLPPSPAPGGNRFSLSRWLVPCLTLWLVWQAWMPLRHYFIPGNGRFNYEGLSFSWRLKTDTRLAYPVQIFVQDDTILARDPVARTRINWNEWKGDKVIYRRVAPGRLNWAGLPEIAVVLEPQIGERVFFNLPASGVRTLEEAQSRIGAIWEEFYGRKPQTIKPARRLPEALAGMAEALRSGGHGAEADRLGGFAGLAQRIERNGLEPQEAKRILGEIRAFLNTLEQNPTLRTQIQLIRQEMGPFVLDGDFRSMGMVLLIQDSGLFVTSPAGLPQINRSLWKNGPETRGPRGVRDNYIGGEPLIVHCGDILLDGRALLPAACIFDTADRPEVPAYIYWNSRKDLNDSKFLHVSNQAFYLRRYARRVAERWREDYGRKVPVHAIAMASLNGRPYQMLVDPAADLATVPAKWMQHNPWVKDMEMPRIPREAVTRAGSLVGQ